VATPASNELPLTSPLASCGASLQSATAAASSTPIRSGTARQSVGSLVLAFYDIGSECMVATVVASNELPLSSPLPSSDTSLQSTVTATSGSPSGSSFARQLIDSLGSFLQNQAMESSYEPDWWNNALPAKRPAVNKPPAKEPPAKASQALQKCPPQSVPKSTICASRNWILLPKAELSKIFSLHDDPSNTPTDNAQSWTELLESCPSSHFRIPSGRCSVIDQVMSAIDHNRSQWFWTFLVLTPCRNF
jgi:hypothetical protein